MDKLRLKIGLALITLLVQLPIYLYLMYWVISHSKPDRLIWFLFIIYIPIEIFLNVTWRFISEK